MSHLKLTLTTDDGEVISTWTIGKKLESSFDIDDIDTEPEHDFYTHASEWTGPDDLGEIVFDEAKNRNDREVDK